MNTDTEAVQRKTWCYQVPHLVLFILYFTLGIDVLFNQIYVITFRSKCLGYAA